MEKKKVTKKRKPVTKELIDVYEGEKDLVKTIIKETEDPKVFKVTEPVVKMKEKVEYTALPDGHVKCICLMDYLGMRDVLFKGDVFLLPERRFKTLAVRGFVEQYNGDKPVIDKR